MMTTSRTADGLGSSSVMLLTTGPSWKLSERRTAVDCQPRAGHTAVNRSYEGRIPTPRLDRAARYLRGRSRLPVVPGVVEGECCRGGFTGHRGSTRPRLRPVRRAAGAGDRAGRPQPGPTT